MRLLIVIPVYNEEEILKQNILKLYNFLKQNNFDNWQIVIADNQSTDKTAQIVKELASKFLEIEHLCIEQIGKGGAIRLAWQKFPAEIYCFMDADLSTDLAYFQSIIKAVKNDGYDMAVGSRFLKESVVKRQFLRKLISFGYHLSAKIITRTKIKDLPCGFKAVNKIIVEQVLPLVKNNEWFFDSELVLLAEKKNLKILEIPVKWQEPAGRKSHVNTFVISWRYLLKLIKIRKRLKSPSFQQ